MNLQPVLKKLYPEGSYGGQCFSFLHNLVDFDPVGNLAADKLRFLKFNPQGILLSRLDSFKVGDIVVQNTPVFDHGSFINYISNGMLQLSESNYNYDLKVHHGRLMRPNDKSILGVVRASLKVPLPPPVYPVQIRVLIMMNGQPFWNSLLQHMANLQGWFWQASGQRVELIIDYKTTMLSGWPVVYTGPVMGGQNVGIIDEKWFENVVLPEANKPNEHYPTAPGPQIVIFNMPRSAWHGSVFDNPNLIELGYCYEKINMDFPVKIMTVSDEHDDFPPYYPTLGAYAKLMAHEIAHAFYGLAVNCKTPCNGRNNTLPPGTDLCHNWFLGQNGSPIAPERFFEDIDFELLAQKVNT
jgi:hypothetical protein